MSAVISQDRGIAASNSTLHIANLTLNDSRPSVVTTGLVHQLNESLTFREMENRRFNVDDEQHGTCEWLLETTQWQQWQNSLDHEDIPRLIWIKGKAGTGKSTILKFAAERGHIPEDDELVLMHFFNGRGTNLERSVEGMYRTLLVQLLENLPGGTKLPNSIGRMLPRGESDWQLGKLVTLFKAVLRVQGRRPITCFVDALDECDDNQIRDMIKSLRSMIEGRERASNRFRICFASRHYPHVSVPQHFVLDLPIEGQSGHEVDVAEYIRSTLIIRDPTLALSIQERVQAKAQGVFMWCNLVVANLNEKHDRGQLNNERDAKQILSKLPGELSELYETMLGLDEDNSAAQDARALTCLQFVLFADMRLTPLELWHAIQLGELLDGRITQEAANDIPSFEDAVLAILHISRGLVELSRRRKWVQVVHESVRDFLLKDSGIARLMGMYARAPLDDSDAQASSFDRLKSVCLEAFYTREHPENGLIRHTLEFALEYAEEALREEIDQSECLARIDDAWSLWQSLEARFYEDVSTSLGTYLTARDVPYLTRIYCRQKLKCDPTHISHLLWQSYRTHSDSLDRSTIRVLVEECCSAHAQGTKKHLLMKLAGSVAWENIPGWQERPPRTTWLAHLSMCSDSLATLVLIAIIPDTSVHAAEVYETAQTQGFEATIILVATKFGASELRPEFKEDVLIWAAGVGHTELVAQLLRDQAVNVNAKQDDYTALYLAVGNDQQAVIDLLLTRADLDIHAPVCWGFTVLNTVVARDKAALLDQLLEWDTAQRKISPNRPGLTSMHRYHQSLLHDAVERCRVSIIEIILRWTGSDLLNVLDAQGQTAYKKAVRLSQDWVGDLARRTHTPGSRKRVVALLASASKAHRDAAPRDTGNGDC